MSQRRREASAWVTGIFNYGSPNRKSDECAATNDDESNGFPFSALRQSSDGEFSHLLSNIYVYILTSKITREVMLQEFFIRFQELE